jgi:hypothetical protein
VGVAEERSRSIILPAQQRRQQMLRLDTRVPRGLRATARVRESLGCRLR